ncbi:MAG: hypothetical protein BWZ07_02840 [Alphaproteobacteria bacterium ADurb.BinA280]|nr:MAG: hypothetical protein BWZ07_02840 [Alphaproteobacteria bacterium ADurb.BinA280]
MLIRSVAQVGWNALALTDNQRKRLCCHDFGKRFPALFGGEGIQVCKLLGADDLDLVRVDGVEITHQSRSLLDIVCSVKFTTLATLTCNPPQRQAFAQFVKQESCA